MANFISLFAGVGGFDKGLEQAGHKCVAQVEWDKNAAGVLKHRWPDVPLFCDVSKVSADDLPDADFITYGFPCQDLSVAGKREGLDGKRSGLFYEATRLIRELRTRGCGLRFAVAENVAGLFSADDGVALARCIRELLDSGACEVGYVVLDSQYFGVAQRRKRVFIVSDFGGESVDEILAITESLPGYSAPSREAGKRTAEDARAGFTASSFGGYEQGCGTLRSQGGDLGGGSETLAVNAAFSDGSQTSSSLTTRCHDQFMPDKGNFCAVIQAQGADVYNGELTGETSATVTSATGIANASGPKVIGWNGDTTPKASEDVSVTLRSQQGGEGVGVAFAFDSLASNSMKSSNPVSGCNETDISKTLDTTTPEPSKNQDGIAIHQNLTVRRLTPIECERLQGFPDDWTSEKMELILEGNEWKATGKVVKQADGPRYKAMGNAVTVNVAEWLGKQIAKTLKEGK
jgi:DNA (cytosine-5)-methyltransferase 1